MVRLMEKKGFKAEQTVRVELHGVNGLPVIPYLSDVPLWCSQVLSFASRTTSFTYQQSFDGCYQSAFKLLKLVYVEICEDLGLLDLQENDVNSNMAKLLSHLTSLRTTYSTQGLRAIPLIEIIDS